MGSGAGEGGGLHRERAGAVERRDFNGSGGGGLPSRVRGLAARVFDESRRLEKARAARAHRGIRMSRAICPDNSGEPHVDQAGEDRRIPRIGLMRAG
ncbi:hypothetical protein [Burkholderia pseudomallei]|uniref:hypothetical protein n=1 Tax=Burkholderia pseudomallei TaxID=28450 RepID=UPI0000F288A8|nr:hypothetical protein [Burkholderia pseudomallei]ABN82747.1 conserved hypothetical protein [Burkholderia pseudomallei 668]AYX27421.1 translation elongation factor 2 [Burkholderia pseudomallei]